MRLTVYAECIYVLFVKILSLLLNTMLFVDKHCCDVCCDEFPVPQTDRKSKQAKNTVAQKILSAISMWKTRYLPNLKYQNLWIINQGKSGKNAICLHFSISAEYLLKI